jgi:hypothetical protein
MENKSVRNKQKQEWNAAHYTQIKVSVDPHIASMFKKTCADTNVSMAKILSQFMISYCQGDVKTKDIAPRNDLSTRGRRRKMVKAHIQGLEQIKTAEETYRDKIPTNLQNSSSYDNAEQSISLLDEAIDLLASAFT